MFAAECHAHFHHAGDFLPETHTARAVDAAAHFLGGNQRADILVHHDAFFFAVARCRRAIAHCDVLQLAFAALVANRTIQRVVDQQEFHHALLRLDGRFGMGMNLHAVGSRCRTGGQRFWRLLHLDQTHAATGRDRQFLVVAEMRDMNARLVRRVHHRGTALDFYLLAINFNIDHYAPDPSALHQATLVFDVIFKFVAEMPEHALYRPN